MSDHHPERCSKKQETHLDEYAVDGCQASRCGTSCVKERPEWLKHVRDLCQSLVSSDIHITRERGGVQGDVRFRGIWRLLGFPLRGPRLRFMHPIISTQESETERGGRRRTLCEHARNPNVEWIDTPHRSIRQTNHLHRMRLPLHIPRKIHRSIHSPHQHIQCEEEKKRKRRHTVPREERPSSPVPRPARATTNHPTPPAHLPASRRSSPTREPTTC